MVTNEFKQLQRNINYCCEIVNSELDEESFDDLDYYIAEINKNFELLRRNKNVEFC